MQKTPEDEAFDELAKRQGHWGGGYQAKRQMAMDKINADFDEEYKKMHEDRIKYGTAWSKDGERIDPMSVYKEQPAQEPVSFPCCGYTDANAIKWNQFNSAVQCHMCGQVYTVAQPAQEPVGFMNGGHIYELQQKLIPYGYVYPKKEIGLSVAVYTAPQHTATWVSLTDADIERIKLMTYEKETNADGEEQEAVNIDWLIKTTEHFCKEKNNGT